ncbi:MAG: nuclease SbcCD subunit D [Chloroflexi bacterium RBG_16_50_9]|nr:MAG: nuclease SbcCD subunit D [Chloroflexi bacterium RBG_16_50_9]
MKILHFADLHLGVENYGRLDPATGLSSRLNDFLSALDQLVDYALENRVDLVLFCGDAYKSREPSQTQQRELAKRINRLSTAGIPMFLLIGNHDLPNAVGRATATEIFDTLSVKNVYVSSRPDVYKIHTADGIVQIVSLPWLRRSALLSREDTRNLTFEQINQKLQEILTNIITASITRLDPTLPAILAAHVWVAGARVGSESLMAIGQEHALLLSNVTQPAFDYVALGHIHKHQVLNNNPPVVYAGSLERVDFGEENDEKGFYIVDIIKEPAPGKREVDFDFHPINCRRFLTINVVLESEDVDPTATTLQAIKAHEREVKDAVVKLKIELSESAEGHLHDNDLRNALKEAHFFTIARDVKRETRLRLGNWTAEEITPLEALKKWMEQQNLPPERTRVLLEYGEKLIKSQQGV